MALPREFARRSRGSFADQGCIALSGSLQDAMRYTRWHHDDANTMRVAVVGGGSAGLAAAIALTQLAGAKMLGRDGRPHLTLDIFEHRSEPSRRQRVFVNFCRLPSAATGQLRFDIRRLVALLASRGASTAPGATLELRVLETCLRTLLSEAANAARGQVAVRWHARAYLPSEWTSFDHIIGADGRRSTVRQALVARIPKVRLAQRALEVEFQYNCDLQWEANQGLHILKTHRYTHLVSWKPVLLYQMTRSLQCPEYIPLDPHDFDVVQSRYRALAAEGRAVYTAPYASSEHFLKLFGGILAVQDTLARAIEGVEDTTGGPVIIAPVEQTLHRAPHLVLPSAGGDASLWLVGDAAVGLPVSKGCNLVYHLAYAGKLAESLLANTPFEYEGFVFDNWHQEAWKFGRSTSSPKDSPGWFEHRGKGKFRST